MLIGREVGCVCEIPVVEMAFQEGSSIPFLITESRKIILPFHASQEIENKISCSRKSQNSNSRERKIDLHVYQ